MLKRVRNKKGFTIIEMMVVIALIGILAAVLVPQFGGVRDKGKEVGVLTNAKMVEAFVSSQIDSDLSIGSLVDAIEAEFDPTTGNPLKNPFTHSTALDAASATDAGAVTGIASDMSLCVVTGTIKEAVSYDVKPAGAVVVTVYKNTTDGLAASITGFDATGTEIASAQRIVSAK